MGTSGPEVIAEEEIKKVNSDSITSYFGFKEPPTSSQELVAGVVFLESLVARAPVSSSMRAVALSPSPLQVSPLVLE